MSNYPQGGGPRKEAQVHILMDHDLKATVVAAAKRTGRSQSEWCRQAILTALANEEGRP